MDKKLAVSLTFGIGAVYDGALGAVFLLAASRMYAVCNVPPPNHFGYVHFPAALLIIFALMFLAVARKPIQNRNLIPYGIMLKIAYCSVVCFHWFTGGIPTMWKPFVFCDIVFLALFYWAYVTLGKQEAPKKT